MHCYIDLFYSTWRSDSGPTHSMPLSPHIISETQRHSSHEIAIAWVPPLSSQIGEHGANSGADEFDCGDCIEGNVLSQYASRAVSYGTKVDRLVHAPERATGNCYSICVVIGLLMMFTQNTSGFNNIPLLW